MKKLLYVKGSPRGELSVSGKIAAAFVEAYRERHPGAEIDEIDLWKAGLPEFNGDSAAAKVSFFGEPAMNEKQRTVYDELVAIFNRFNAAADDLFTVPMWNFGVSYKLKQYIDLLSMPGTVFGFDPKVGYIGLLKNKRATAIYTAAIFSPGVPPALGTDHASTYFEAWLRFAGVQDIASVTYWGTKMRPGGRRSLKFHPARAKHACDFERYRLHPGSEGGAGADRLAAELCTAGSRWWVRDRRHPGPGGVHRGAGHVLPRHRHG